MLNIWVFPKNGGFSPQIIHFDRVFHYKPSILGYHHFWNHPYEYGIIYGSMSLYYMMLLLTFFLFETGSCLNLRHRLLGCCLNLGN